jgi:hypothetical protein
MVLAAMLAMMMVAAAPAMAQTTDHDDGDLVDFPACFPFCEDNSFEDGFFLVSLDEGVFSDGDIDFDSDDIDIDFDSNDGDNDFDHNDSDDNDSDVDFDDNDSDRNNNGGNGGRN